MKDLVTKLTKAALEVGGSLKADKKNLEQKYDYLSADKILSICGQALFAQGIAVIPKLTEQEINLYEYTDQYGKAKRRYDCKVNFNIVVSDGENTIESPWYGMGSDYTVPDKAMYKAITSGHKYFLMKLLCIGEGNEDGEHEGEDNGSKQEERKQTTTRPTPVTTGQATPDTTQQPAPPPATNGSSRPFDPIRLRDMLHRKAASLVAKTPTPEQRNMLAANLEICFAGPNATAYRKTFTRWIFDESSTKDLDGSQVLALTAWLNVKQDSTGEWLPDVVSVKEANSALTEALKAEGQQTLI